MSLGTPLTPALLSLASMPPSINFRRGSIQESLTTIRRGGFSGEDISAVQTVVLRPCNASEMKRMVSMTTSLPTKSPVHATRTRFFPSMSKITVSSKPIRQSGAHERPTKILKNSSGFWLISMGAVERDPPLSKNVRIMWCPKNHRQGAECRPSCAYKSSAVFPAASMYELFTVFGVLLIFISPMALTSLQSNCFKALATSAGRRTRSGF